MLPLFLAIIFTCIALVLFLLVARQRRQLGLPAGRLIFADSRFWTRVEKALYDPELRLTGKPDYLVEQANQVIPVEVKARRAPPAPFDSHIYQLAAYCLLVERAYGTRPKQGYIHYTDRTFSIAYTSDLESSVKEIIHQMQAINTRASVNRSHANPRICLHCGYRSVCDQSL
ncbi:MAG: CRISPR-associated protein Cas4 [Acidobacteriaceae bacterium]